MSTRPLIEDINLITVDINKCSITGLQGSVDYNSTALCYSQDTASNLVIPKADILISHESGYHYLSTEDKTFEGFKAIDKYLKEKSPLYNFFGHHHQNTEFTKYNTTCFCIYGCSIFDTDTKKIINIFT